MRGKRPGRGKDYLAHRLIPARAGKTAPPSTPPRQLWAHPRACGENDPGSLQPERLMGSSPRVRGKLPQAISPCNKHGLIPARAGKTGHEKLGEQGHRAHPRACGENTNMSNITSSAPGSSPRVRGKRLPRGTRAWAGRLIPARAGKTPLVAFTCNANGAHPRACGENSGHIAADISDAGSSPRVRGKQCSGNQPLT